MGKLSRTFKLKTLHNGAIMGGSTDSAALCSAGEVSGPGRRPRHAAERLCTGGLALDAGHGGEVAVPGEPARISAPCASLWLSVEWMVNIGYRL